MVAEGALIARLRDGDEQAFVELISAHHASLLRLAQAYVPNRAVAEEVVQETWLAVLRGVDRFESRSSLKTWLFRILLNRARSAGVREERAGRPAPDEGGIDPARFDGNGAWSDPPEPWTDGVDARLDAARLATAVRAHLDDLPPAQRRVVILRDIEGLTSREVCDLLGISEGNQRVLLHRGRLRLRSEIEARVVGT